MATDSRTILAHAVQTSADFSTWTDQPTIRCDEASEGCGQTVGAATLTRPYGVLREPGTVAPALRAPLDGLTGQWVRVLIADAGGSVTIGGATYAPIWWGIIDTDERADDGGGAGAQGWTCTGIIGHLSRVRIGSGWVECLSSGSTVADYIYRVPAFNTPAVGGRSAGTYTIDGKTVYIANGIAGAQWTAKQILENILASHGRVDLPDGAVTFRGGVTWTLAAGTLLDYKPDALDLTGSSVLDALNMLVNARRGMTYRVTVSGTTATITVMSVSATALTAGGIYGSYTLPAATETAAPDLTGLWIGNVRLGESQVETYDHIQVIGARPWVAITLAYDPTNATVAARSLVAGWGSTEETIWNLGAQQANSTSDVWRMFNIPTTWDGRQYGGTYGLRTNLYLDGNDDLTGSRAFGSTVAFPPTVLELTPDIPSSPGATPTNPTGARIPAKVFYQPAGSSVWKCCTSATNYEPRGPDMPRSLEVWRSPGYVRIGDQGLDQLGNKYAFDGGKVLVTLGVREADPLVMTWTRASADWPRTSPRVLYHQAPNCEQWAVLPGTVMAINNAGALATQAVASNTDPAETETFIRDDRDQMRALLAFLRAYYGEPARTLAWRDRGVISHGYGAGICAPGVLLTGATLGTGAVTINAIVTRRTWRFAADGYGTGYTSERVVPDLEAIK